MIVGGGAVGRFAGLEVGATVPCGAPGPTVTGVLRRREDRLAALPRGVRRDGGARRDHGEHEKEEHGPDPVARIPREPALPGAREHADDAAVDGQPVPHSRQYSCSGS